jgi:hypothetical protein
VSRDVNTLEYWGENLSVMGELRPLAQAVGKIYQRAAELAQAQVNSVAAQITNPTDNPLMPTLQKFDQLQNLATYSERMNDYAIALSIDPADPQRKQIADKAIQYLSALDTEDQPVRPQVRLHIAKLDLVKEDFESARKLLDEMTTPDFKPTPTVQEAYEARYFRALADVLDKKPADARKAMENLLAWQQASLPPDATTQRGAAAAAAMLEYRIDSLEADLATDPDAKAKSNGAAREVLLKLQAEHPEFRGIISDLVIARLPENAQMDQLDPVMLDALVRRGAAEVSRPANENADTRTIGLAASAAKELIARKGKETDPQTLEDATFALGFLQQRSGDGIDAINAFLDFVTQYPQSTRAAVAMQNAEAEIVKAKKTQADDSRLGEAYDRFLPLAINPPYNRKALALEYGERLERQGKAKEALQYLAEVPADDKRVLSAKFYQMIAAKQVLDQLPPGDAQRAALLLQIQSLADAVNKLAAEAATPGVDQNQKRSMLVRTRLLAAEVARVDQKDPARAISLLENFEQSSAGLPNENSLLSEALLIRVQSLMALGKNSDATQALVTLLKTKEGGQGAQIVYTLLVKLDADYDTAQHAGNTDAMKTLAQSRASLSGFLVDWAKNNPDPKIRQFTYRYTVYEADTKQRAAELEDTPEGKTAALQEAFKLYRGLESEDGLKQYKATLPADQQSEVTYDPAVMRGIAMVDYDAGNFADAQTRLATLLQDGRLGSPLIDVDENGQTQTVDNDAYWEAVLKLIRCNVKLNADVEGQKTFLKNLIVRWGDHVGGKKWQGEFAQLRKELIPDFVPPPADGASAN